MVEIVLYIYETDFNGAGYGFLFLNITLYYANGGWVIEKMEEAFFSQRLHSSLEPQ